MYWNTQMHKHKDTLGRKFKIPSNLPLILASSNTPYSSFNPCIFKYPLLFLQPCIFKYTLLTLPSILASSNTLYSLFLQSFHLHIPHTSSFNSCIFIYIPPTFPSILASSYTSYSSFNPCIFLQSKNNLKIFCTSLWIHIYTPNYVNKK